jgi:hypothetical protein
MISKSERKKLLNKISSSQEFSNSKLYERYLTYLVECSEQNNIPKETTIAIEAFGKDADFNPAEDTIVRSHTYTLRKKLESYYYNEGKNDPYRLVIPKGHYEAKFMPAENNLRLPRVWYKRLRQYYTWIIIIFLAACLLYVWNQNHALYSQLSIDSKSVENDPIWRDYLESNVPIMIVPGDHFLYNTFLEKFQRNVAVRDFLVNSIEDFEKLKQDYPQYELKLADEPYFPYHSIWTLPPILLMLDAANRKPILRRASSVIPQVLNEYNFIFLGSIKTLYIFKHTLAKSNLSYEIAPHKITYTSPDSNKTQIFRTNLHSTGPNEDLVIALKLPGPVDNTIFIIASYHSLGAPAIAEFLTTDQNKQNLIRMFKEKYGRMPAFFEVLFKVVGIDKTAYDTEILLYNEIKKE